MTYIRMTGGRDRGSVKDFPFPEAQEMLALGQALPVDFNERDPLGFRELAEPLSAVSSQPSAETVAKVIDLIDKAEVVPEVLPDVAPRRRFGRNR
jgi:hypothetical protein